MNRFFRRTLSLFLSASLACSLGISAAASNALGEDLSSRDTLLNQETQLSTNVFWSSAYSDLRTENVVTYTPNEDVTPIVTYGDTLPSRITVSSAAKSLESQGYRVVAGINGDFFNTSTGLPIGLVVSEGELLSTDGGYYAIGFRADGTAVLGKPTVKVSADLGYELLNDYGTPTKVVRQLTGVNKARVSTGGIYLYTYDFNSRHTTGNTEAGVDVICTIDQGSLTIGGELTATVDQVVEATSATAIGPDQIVLSANLQSSSYNVDALRRIPVGSTITLSVTASSEKWNDVEYAVGALYSLVENGSVVSGLSNSASPRTAIGQKADGTLVFYTIDGRKSGHSIGASLNQLAQRMVELGCVTALCLDGGGSTAITVTQPDKLTAKTISTPSDGSERAVTNHVFLVATSEPSGRLGSFYVQADHSYVLAGSKVTISAAALDTNFIPMDDESYDLETSGGTLDGNVLTTPAGGGDITVTAYSGSKQGSTTVHAIKTPDSITVRNSSGTAVSGISVADGASAALVASAVYNHMALQANQEAFTWTVTGDIGTISNTGIFTATAPGTGTITVTAGGKSATVSVTVAGTGLERIESFDGANTIFRGSGTDMDFSLTSASDAVKMGRGAAKVDYTLTEANGYAAQWRAAATTAIGTQHSSLNVWVRGDGSGNTLSFLYSDGTTSSLLKPITTLDFTGWKQVSVPVSGTFSIQGLAVSGTAASSGTICLDQITASHDNIVDTEVPAVSASLDGAAWQLTATVADAVDGVLPKSAISVTYSGGSQKSTALDFSYDTASGALTVSLPQSPESHDAMRLTITARDASGNIGRASVDVEPTSTAHKFTDIDGYWAATYVDFLYSTGITTGYEDGTFRPNQNITRAQFSAMLFRYLGLNESDYASVQLPFADNRSIPSYAVPAVKALYSKGIINGSTGADGKLYFNPNASLTRAQAATMIGRTQEKGYATTALTFSDAASIPSYATYYIQTMVAQGVISGYSDGTFLPNASITRGQMAKILYNLL